MALKSIPSAVKKEIDQRVETFNRTVIRNPDVFYRTRYRGRYLYLDRYNYGRMGPICRLTYTGDIENWEFAIYRYSKERYDPDEWFFHGAENVDGTVEGAMAAGLEAYPA